MSTHCFASASQAWPVAQDIEASCSPCIPQPSARANGAERTKANSDAVIVFIVFSYWLSQVCIAYSIPYKKHIVTAETKRAEPLQPSLKVFTVSQEKNCYSLYAAAEQVDHIVVYRSFYTGDILYIVCFMPRSAAILCTIFICSVKRSSSLT